MDHEATDRDAEQIGERRGPVAAGYSRARAGLGRVVGSPLGWLVLIVAIGIVARTYRFTEPLLDAHLWRQTQTASTVWLFHRDGFDPLGYHVPIYGGGHLVLEFPSYQSVVYVLTLATGYYEWVGRLVSILSYVAAALLLFLIVRRWSGRNLAGLFAVFFFSFLPISVFYFRAFMIDPFVIALTLTCLYAATRLWERFSWNWLFVYGVTLALASLTKATIVVALGLPLVTLGIRILLSHQPPRVGKVALVGSWLATGLLFVVWSRHADRLNVSSGGEPLSEQRDWYFGSTLTDSALWTTVGERLLENTTILGMGLCALGLAAVATAPKAHRLELCALVVGAVVSISIFANLNQVHDYYQLVYSVPIAVFGGLGLTLVYTWAQDAIDVRAARTATAGVALALAGLWALTLYQGYFAPGALALPIKGHGEEIEANTPDERLVLVEPQGDRNDPALLYQARRIGWRVPVEAPGELNEVLAQNSDVRSVVLFAGGNTPVTTDQVRAVLNRYGFQEGYISPIMTVWERRPVAASD